MPDKVLTLSSNHCQRLRGCPRVALPDFLKNHQVYFLQAIGVTLIVLPRSPQVPVVALRMHLKHQRSSFE